MRFCVLLILCGAFYFGKAQAAKVQAGDSISVEARNHRVYSGTVVEINDSTLVVRLPDSAIYTIEKVAVKKAHLQYGKEKELIFLRESRIPNVGTIVPTAFNLSPGRAYFRTHNLLYYDFGLGITRYLTLHATSFVIPLFLGPVNLAGAKFSLPVSEKFRVAVGGHWGEQHSYFEENTTQRRYVFNFTIGYGSTHRHINLGAIWVNNLTEPGFSPALTYSAQIRLSDLDQLNLEGFLSAESNSDNWLLANFALTRNFKHTQFGFGFWVFTYSGQSGEIYFFPSLNLNVPFRLWP